MTTQQLEAFRRFRDATAASVPLELDLPEPSMQLGEAARASDDARLMKHFAQMLFFHLAHWRQAMSLTALSAVDGYLTMADAGNPLGLYLVARSLLELDGVTTYTLSELRRFSDGKKFDWKERGRKSFALVIRARVATGNPAARANMEQRGVSGAKVIHVNDGIKALTEAGNLWAKPHYDFLSDFAHPNFGSRTIGVGGGYIGGSVAYGKSTFHMTSNTAITAYRYRSPAAMEAAISSTCEKALENARHIFKEIEEADLPFSQEELLATTGTSNPFKEVPREAMASSRATSVRRQRRFARNELCHCGSGKKFKKCHGADLH